jgi:hypothetical protein
MKLRQFNAGGVERFRSMLQVCREDPHVEIDFQLLENNTFTEEIVSGIEVTGQIFKTKGDAGQYLHSLLGLTALTHNDITSNTGLWAWLSLFFFDSVCPKNLQGRRSVKSDYYYVYDPKIRDHYRHLLHVSWRVLDITQKDSQPHRLITTTPIDTMDSVTDEIIKKLYLIRIPRIFEVLDRIYWNKITQKAQKNIVGKKVRKGDLNHRFPAVIRQLEKTYDLQTLNADQLIELLGEEFDFSLR